MTYYPRGKQAYEAGIAVCQHTFVSNDPCGSTLKIWLECLGRKFRLCYEYSTEAGNGHKGNSPFMLSPLSAITYKSDIFTVIRDAYIFTNDGHIDPFAELYKSYEAERERIALEYDISPKYSSKKKDLIL